MYMHTLKVVQLVEDELLQRPSQRQAREETTEWKEKYSAVCVLCNCVSLALIVLLAFGLSDLLITLV